MAHKIKWTEAAWGDVEEIADYIVKDSPCYSAAFIRELRSAARSLAHFAERGRMVPELGNSEICELFVSGYRLIYRITKQKIYILGIIYGARNLLKI